MRIAGIKQRDCPDKSPQYALHDLLHLHILAEADHRRRHHGPYRRARDNFGNPLTNYGGTVDFTGTASPIILPADYTFTARSPRG